MVDTQLASAAFVDCAQRIAFGRCMADARRKGMGVVLKLTKSQLARDGLAAAASAFVRTFAHRSLTEDELLSLAMQAAGQAPVEIWWHAHFSASRPAMLSEGDVWRSLEEFGSDQRLLIGPHDTRHPQRAGVAV